MLETKYNTFNVVEMMHPYHAIFGSGFTNIFSVVVHQGYLCMKLWTIHRIISIFDHDHKMTRELEGGIALGQQSVHVLEEEHNKQTNFFATNLGSNDANIKSRKNL